jgi:hypothetical protein
VAGLICAVEMGRARSIGPHSGRPDTGGDIEAGTAREAAVMDDTSSAQLLSKGSARGPSVEGLSHLAQLWTCPVGQNVHHG